MHPLWPSPLKPGDIVEIIAPAYGYEPKIIENLKALAKEWDFQARIPENLFGEDLLCANSDEIRFQHLKEALYSKDSNYIWVLRGGYGSARLLPMLKELSPPLRPKILIGSSDITALHAFLNQQWGWPSIHGVPIKQAAIKEVSEESITQLQNLLFGRQKKPIVHPLKPLNQQALTSSLIEAPIGGGNLCIVETSLGTFWHFDGCDKIILLEEVDEQGYRIDRSFNHLLQAGVFDGAKAVLLGDFIGGKEKDGSSKVEPAVIRFAESLSIPTFRIEGIGHGFVDLPLPFGIPVTLTTGFDAELSYFINLNKDLCRKGEEEIVVKN